MAEAVVFAGGLVVGLAVGRWWALAAAVAFGLFVGAANELELSAWLIGSLYGLIAAAGVAVGVWFRKRRRGRA
jgi:hypothetical protein